MCWGEHRQTGIIVIGSGHAKPSTTENGRMDERPHTLDVKQSNKDSVDPCSSLCAAQPATRRRNRCGDAPTLWNANFRVVSTETVPRASVYISVIYGPTPYSLRYYPLFWEGVQTTPLCFSSLPAPQYTILAPPRGAKKALGTMSSACAGWIPPRTRKKRRLARW